MKPNYSVCVFESKALTGTSLPTKPLRQSQGKGMQGLFRLKRNKKGEKTSFTESAGEKSNPQSVRGMEERGVPLGALLNPKLTKPSNSAVMVCGEA